MMRIGASMALSMKMPKVNSGPVLLSGAPKPAVSLP
jgi:hypothetical protein